MNILIVYYQSFLIKDLEECLTRMGHSYKCIEANVIVELSDEDFCVLLDRELEIEHYDCVFTFNYSSIISDCMVKYNIPYISFVYDSPMYRLFKYGSFTYLLYAVAGQYGEVGEDERSV